MSSSVEAHTLSDELSGVSVSDTDMDIPSPLVPDRQVETVGVLPSGERFNVPETMSVIATLVKPRSWRSPTTIVWVIMCLATTCTVLCYFQGILPKWFFCVQFVFWRLMYNVGIGYMLRVQSNSSQVLTWFTRHIKSSPKLLSLLKTSVVFSADDVPLYSPAKYPDEFNAWMVFRFVVNVILANDLVSYLVLVMVCWEKPDFSSVLEIACHIVGVSLILFALWSKADAHRVIGDYAWYWGDFFFLLDKHLVFDGIFQMFPHPMYTVGYAFMYGFPLMAKSYTLFYMSLLGHLLQFAFLVLVENPHIDKTYNTLCEPTAEEKERDAVLYSDGENGVGYFNRKELVGLLNFDPFRSGDALLAVLVIYLVVIGFMLNVPWWFHILHCCAWRLFHTVVLGWVLHEQSTKKRWTHVHHRSSREAFEHWKSFYNTSVTMTNFSFVVCAVRLFEWNNPIFDTTESRVTLFVVGALLVAVNVYVSTSAFAVVGDYGFFYGDFFIDDAPAQLNYSGIYRYLNNPDSSLGLAGYYGVVLMSGSSVMLPVAVFSHVCVKSFEVVIEATHMQRKYGRTLRRAGGLRAEIRKKGEALKLKLEETKKEYEGNVQRLKKELDKRKADYERFVTVIRRKKDDSKKKKA